MPIEFKDSIDVDGNIKASQAFIDSNDSAGTIGQILTSTGSVSQWSDVVPGASTLVEIACKNTSGGTITVGTPVYQTGTVGATATIEVAPANALISAGNYPAIGLLKTTLGNNDFGFVVITGELTNIITSPIDGTVPTTGDTIYLKSGGGLTLTKPTGEGNAIQNMGLVGKVSTGTAGSITVSSIMRANDVPNLPEGRIWIGDGNTLVSDTVFVDEPNLRLGIGTTAPSEALDVVGKIALNDGGFNVFVGEGAGLSNVSGYVNVAIGRNSLYSNTNGIGNSSFGESSLRFNTLGNYNAANGQQSLFRNTTGNNNTANGSNSLLSNTTGDQNTANGSNSGRFISDGTTANSVTQNSVYLGTNTKALANNQTNQIVIGYDATGIGSNSVVLGNDSITKTALKGNVGIGTTTPTEKLEVSGNIKAEGSVQVGDNTDTATASNVGAMRYTTDGSASFADMCMEVASGTYEWVNIVTNTF